MVPLPSFWKMEAEKLGEVDPAPRRLSSPARSSLERDRAPPPFLFDARFGIVHPDGSD